MLAALALAGALGIFAFSAFQPVSAQTISTDVIRSFGEPQVATDGTVTVDVTITVSNVDIFALANVTETLPDGWDYESIVPSDADPVVDDTESRQMISFTCIIGPVRYVHR